MEGNITTVFAAVIAAIGVIVAALITRRHPPKRSVHEFVVRYPGTAEDVPPIAKALDKVGAGVSAILVCIGILIFPSPLVVLTEPGFSPSERTLLNIVIIETALLLFFVAAWIRRATKLTTKGNEHDDDDEDDD